MLDTDHTADRSDHYRRDALATRIAGALVKPLGDESVVIALDGPWGSGKSWLLDQVEKDLKKNPKITQDVLQPSQPQGSQKFSCHFLDRLKSLFTNSKLIDPLPASSHRVEDNSKNNTPALVVRFNPWQIGEESDLIQEFLIQIAMDLRPMTSTFTEGTKKSKAAGKKLIKYIRALSYGKYLKYIPVVSPVGQIIEDASNAASENLDMLDKLMDADKEAAPSLSEARESAKEAIKELGTRLIIMIDDIDRLRSREIRAVMQLVKSVLDFPNTSFLLAFDSEQVARALAEDGDQDRGMRYLEKIIQLSINVPPLDQQLILDDVKARFNQTLTQTGHTLRSYEEPLIDEALKLVAGLCDTPRNVVRWANHFFWALDALQGSINVADIAIMEGIRIKSRKASFATLLSCNSDFDPSIVNPHFWTQIDKTYNSAHIAITNLFPSKNLHDAIAFIFPSLAGNEYSNSLDKQSRRIGHHEIFDIYKKFNTGSTNISGNLIDQILNDPTQLKTRLESISYPVPSSTELDNFRFFTEYISPDTLPDKYEKIIPLLDFINKFSNDQVNHDHQELPNISVITKHIILSRCSEKNQPQLMEVLHNISIEQLFLTTRILCTWKILPKNENYSRTQIAIQHIIEFIVNHPEKTSHINCQMPIRDSGRLHHPTAPKCGRSGSPNTPSKRT